MATEVTMYKSISGKLYETVEEAQDGDYRYKVGMVAHSVEKCVEEPYPDAYVILRDCLVEIKKQFTKLSKSELQRMIERVQSQIDEK